MFNFNNENSNFLNRAKQFGKGALLFGAGVLGYFGLSAVFRKNEESQNDDLVIGAKDNLVSDSLNSVLFDGSFKTMPISSLATTSSSLKFDEKIQTRRSGDVYSGTDEFQVNTYTTDYQYSSAVGSLGANGFVIVWTSDTQDGNGAGIYGQRYYLNGTRQGAEFQINTYTTYEQVTPKVAGLVGGGFVVTWVSDQQGPTGTDNGVYGQQYDAAGVKVGSEFHVNTYTLNYSCSYSPSISNLNDGGFVVVWQDDGQDGDETGIYGQRYDLSGVRQGSEFQVSTYTTSYQQSPSVASLGANGFVVVWESYGQDGDSYGIYGQRYDLSGVKQGSEFQVNTYTNSRQGNPSIASIDGSNFVVVWESSGIYGQRYDFAGTKMGDEFQVNTYGGNQLEPSVSGLAEGGFVVVWMSDGQDGDQWGIYAQQYDATGVRVGGEFQINIYTSGMQQHSSVSGLTEGGFVVTWSGEGQDEVLWGVYGRLLCLFLPKLIINRLTIDEGETVILDNTILNATYADYSPQLEPLSFKINNVQHGQFEYVNNPGILIDEFFQPNITAGMVQFVHDGGETAPSYDIRVSDSGCTTGYSPVEIIFTNNVNDPPVLVNNQLTINEAQKVVLNDAVLNATDIDNDDSLLVFTVNNVQHGQFELVTNPGVPITSFIQQEIIDEQIRFIHDGSESEPSYEVKVSDGELETAFTPASITFNHQNDTPQIIYNRLTIMDSQEVILTGEMLSATDPDNDGALLRFIVRNVVAGYFDSIDNQGVTITEFTQQQIIDGKIRFTHDGGTTAPAYEVKVSDDTAETAFMPAAITFDVNETPVLINNHLTIKEGQSVVLTSDMLSATDADSDNSQLTFMLNSVRQGYFDRVTIPGKSITNFRQQEIEFKNIRFVHDGGEDKPYYKVKVSDGQRETDWEDAEIEFTNVADPKEKSQAWIGVLVGGLVFLVCTSAITAVVTVTGVYVAKKRKQMKAQQQEIELLESTLDLGTFLEDSKIKAEDLEIGDHLGSGAQATVYKAIWQGRTVAYKIFSAVNQNDIQGFEDEARIMLKSNHPNIVRLYGICIRQGTFGLVMEFVEMGTLKEVLQKQKTKLDWKAKWNIAYDLASVLKFLHEKDFVHRDIKTDNVLLHKDGEEIHAKVADFGLSKMQTSKDQSATMTIGTFKYMAPEMALGSEDYEAGHFPVKPVDVYAFGMTLVALITEKEPYSKRKNDMSIPAEVGQGKLWQKLDERKCPFMFFNLTNRCRAIKSADRPTAEKIVEELDGMKSQVVDFKV